MNKISTLRIHVTTDCFEYVKLRLQALVDSWWRKYDPNDTVSISLLSREFVNTSDWTDSISATYDIVTDDKHSEDLAVIKLLTEVPGHVTFEETEAERYGIKILTVLQGVNILSVEPERPSIRTTR